FVVGGLGSSLEIREIRGLLCIELRGLLAGAALFTFPRRAGATFHLLLLLQKGRSVASWHSHSSRAGICWESLASAERSGGLRFSAGVARSATPAARSGRGRGLDLVDVRGLQTLRPAGHF